MGKNAVQTSIEMFQLQGSFCQLIKAACSQQQWWFKINLEDCSVGKNPMLPLMIPTLITKIIKSKHSPDVCWCTSKKPPSYIVRKTWDCIHTWENTNAHENEECEGIHIFVKLVDLPESSDYF